MSDVFLHDNAVLSISVDPSQSKIFATACESGEISIFDLRSANSDPIIVASSMRIDRFTMGGAYHACCYNPVNSNLLAIANEVSGIELLDLRMTRARPNKPLLRYRSKRGGGNNDDDDDAAAGSSSSSSSRKRSSQYEYGAFCQNVMSVVFNSTGTRLAALRYKLRPVIYETNDPEPKFLFDHESYKNTCTMKRCCFAGHNDEFLVSG